MIRYKHGVRKHLNATMSFLYPIRSLNRTKLFWGIGVIAVAVPAAYVGLYNKPTDFFQQNDKVESYGTIPHIEQPALSSIPDGLESDGNSTDEPLPDDTFDVSVKNHNETNTQVTINGEEIALPAQGTMSKEIHTQDGKSTLDVSIQSNTSGVSTSRSKTSTKIELRSSTRSESSGID